MRRSDREIRDTKQILSIMEKCDIVRIGLMDGDFPYIVPLNFGFTCEDGKICLYVHGAMAGRKFELMKRNGKCSFEMDRMEGIVCSEEKRSATTHYQSVMGTASIEFPEGEEKGRGLRCLMDHYEKTRNFDYDPAVLPRTAVARLTVLEISAKSNPGPDKRKQP